jgi:hypothetical protein
MANDSKAGLNSTASKTGLRGVLLPTCREMTQHSSVRLDQSIPWWRQPGIQLHLIFCSVCRRYRRQVEWIHTHATLANDLRSTGLASALLRSEARTRTKQKLAAAAAVSCLPGARPPPHSVASAPASDSGADAPNA